MKKSIRPYLTLVAVSFISLLTSGCYFNSAGHIFSRASYNATANTNDLKVGDTAYRDSNGNYYIELPRYRKEKKIVTNYFLLEEAKRPVITKDMNDTTLFQITPEYAMYITGQRASVSPSACKLTPQSDADTIKKSADRLSVVRKGASISTEYKYSSPNAAWFYTAGVFDWLCVDLPMTCIENSLVIVGVVTGKVMQSVGSAAARGATYAANYDAYKKKYPCPTCGGDGLVGATYIKYNGFGERIGSDSGDAVCPDCSGSGMSKEGSDALWELTRSSAD